MMTFFQRSALVCVLGGLVASTALVDSSYAWPSFKSKSKSKKASKVESQQNYDSYPQQAYSKPDPYAQPYQQQYQPPQSSYYSPQQNQGYPPQPYYPQNQAPQGAYAQNYPQPNQQPQQNNDDYPQSYNSQQSYPPYSGAPQRNFENYGYPQQQGQPYPEQASTPNYPQQPQKTNYGYPSQSQYDQSPYQQPSQNQQPPQPLPPEPQPAQSQYPQQQAIKPAPQDSMASGHKPLPRSNSTSALVQTPTPGYSQMPQQQYSSPQTQDPLRFYKYHAHSPIRIQIYDGKKLVTVATLPALYADAIISPLMTGNIENLKRNVQNLLLTSKSAASEAGLPLLQPDHLFYVYCEVVYQLARALGECRKAQISTYDIQSTKTTPSSVKNSKKVVVVGDEIYNVFNSLNAYKSIPQATRDANKTVESASPTDQRSYWISIFHTYNDAPFSVATFTTTHESLWVLDFLGEGRGNAASSARNMSPSGRRILHLEAGAALHAVLALPKKDDTWVGWDGNSSQFGNGTDRDVPPPVLIKRLQELYEATKN